jgi:hypothetical protein
VSRGKPCSHLPEAHIGLHQDQVANRARVGRAGSRLEHKPAILRVKDGANGTEGAKLQKRDFEKKDDKAKELTQRWRLSSHRYHLSGSATWRGCQFDIEKAQHLWHRRRVVLSCTRSIWAGVSGHGRNVSSREHLVSPQKLIPEPVL